MTLQPYFRPCAAIETSYLVNTVRVVFGKLGDTGFRARNFLRQLREPLVLSLGRRVDGRGALRHIDDARLHAAPSSMKNTTCRRYTGKTARAGPLEHHYGRNTRPIGYLLGCKLRLCLRLVLFGARQSLFGFFADAVGLTRSALVRVNSRRHEPWRPRRRGTQNRAVNSVAQTQKNDAVALAKEKRHILIGGRVLAARVGRTYNREQPAYTYLVVGDKKRRGRHRRLALVHGHFRLVLVGFESERQNVEGKVDIGVQPGVRVAGLRNRARLRHEEGPVRTPARTRCERARATN